MRQLGGIGLEEFADFLPELELNQLGKKFNLAFGCLCACFAGHRFPGLNFFPGIAYHEDMNETFERIKALITENDVLVSVHGYEELAEDNLYVSDLVNNAAAGIVIEDYPEYHKGPAILVLQKDDKGLPVHVVWGIPKDKKRPAVIVTAYRPDRNVWTKDLKRRLKK